MIRRIFLYCLLIVLGSSCTKQNINKPRLDSLLTSLQGHNKAMGSLAISVDGQVIYSRAFGYRSINGNEKIAPDSHTKYRIGSISKMFTATMIFQLIEEGKLKLNDRLANWFPELPNAQKITIGNMLNHRSGLYNFTNDAAYWPYSTQPCAEAEMTAIFAKQKPDFEPDEKAEYSNTNFVLLGYIIERITKKAYSEELKERIVSKIGLNDTYYGGKTNVKNNEAHSYVFAVKWMQMEETDMSIPGGAGAIISTPTDLTKFIEALFAGKLISMDHLNLMKTLNDNYGMAMFETDFDGKKGYGHDGGIDLFRSTLTYFPDQKLAIAYCSNSGAYNFDKVKEAALSIYFHKPFTFPEFKTSPLKPEVLDKYLGVYSTKQTSFKITITKNNSTLIAQGTGQPQFVLEPVAQDRFIVSELGAISDFEPSKNRFVLEQGDSEMYFTKDK